VTKKRREAEEERKEESWVAGLKERRGQGRDLIFLTFFFQNPFSNFKHFKVFSKFANHFFLKINF
jgi:hypothetical protein